MASKTLVVRGYRELMQANARAPREVRLATRHDLRDVGDLVRQDAIRRFAPVDARSAAGYKTRVRQRGIAVEQSIPRTTGRHPQYGSLQMRRALLPALMSNEDELMRRLDRTLDKIAYRYERYP